MSSIERILKHPHAIIVVALVAILMGILGYQQMPTNLFPDTNRPMISVVTQWPGATADDVAREVTHPIEVRLSALDGVRRVTSTSRDQVSLVQIEFEYGNDVDLAAARTEIELKRIVSDMPQGAKDSLIYRITDAAHPAMILSLTSSPEAKLSFAQLRRLAENPIRDKLLNVPGVAEAEVFGGQYRQVAVDLNRDKLVAHDLDINQVAVALAANNTSKPSGLIERDHYRLLLTTRKLAKNLTDIANILVPVTGGGFVRVKDLGEVHWGYKDLTSLYQGNGKPAVAIALLRSETGNVADVVNGIKQALPEIKQAFPMVQIEVADTQERLINLTVSNMLDALRDAIIMALFVILLFLGNSRAALITALSLPFTYLLTFAVMRFIDYEFNMVTLTAIIIGVGMLADDAIVVIENIQRHMEELGEKGVTAAIKGTQEILLADFSGTFSVIVVLVPIIFIGGYVQTVLQPLSVMLVVALCASFIVSVTIIPLIAPYVIKANQTEPLAFILQPFEHYVLNPFKRFYVNLISWALTHRALVLTLSLVVFVFSAKQMNLVGRELMPLMDTGTFQVNFEAAPDTNEAQMQKIMQQVDSKVRQTIPNEWIISSSMVVGSEAGVKAFGATRTFQQGQATFNLIDRFHRDQTIYQIEQKVREQVRAIPGILTANVTEFGATPLSSIRGSVDVMVTGPDWKVLDKIANEVQQRLSNVAGLTGVERSWQSQSRRLQLEVDATQAHHFGLSVDNIAHQVANYVGGTSGGRLRVTGENPIPVWVRLDKTERNNREMLAALPIRLPSGELIPLSNLAKIQLEHAPALYTHQALQPTIDIIGYRRNIAITHLQENIDQALQGISLPRGYKITHEGEIKQMQESFTRLFSALALGIAFLFLSLVVIFKSFLKPIAIMISLPLSIIGAAWAMVLADKHGCMPSFMGLILLMGIVVNNGILLVTFIQDALEKGATLSDAILNAVQVRARPILMTAGSTIVGMLPIALEWAVGLERLSPLAVVAIGGLIVSTFMTLLVIPVLFHVLESARRYFTAKHEVIA